MNNRTYILGGGTPRKEDRLNLFSKDFRKEVRGK